MLAEFKSGKISVLTDFPAIFEKGKLFLSISLFKAKSEVSIMKELCKVLIFLAIVLMT